MTSYMFRTPHVEEAPSGGHRLFAFYKRYVGISVAKTTGSYFTVRDPGMDEVETYSEFYQGGSLSEVSAEVKTALLASGLDITEDNFTAI